jgi:hypothetical protein
MRAHHHLSETDYIRSQWGSEILMLKQLLGLAVWLAASFPSAPRCKVIITGEISSDFETHAGRHTDFLIQII